MMTVTFEMFQSYRSYVDLVDVPVTVPLLSILIGCAVTSWRSVRSQYFFNFLVGLIVDYYHVGLRSRIGTMNDSNKKVINKMLTVTKRLRPIPLFIGLTFANLRSV